MTYNEFIQNILDTRGRFSCGDEYHERHHILPKCMGGTNEEENLIDLFAQEHYEAHKLLALEHPNERGLQIAWLNMSRVKNSFHNRKIEISSEEYENIRKYCSIAMSGSGNPMYGVHLCGEKAGRYNKPFSEESKRKISEHHANVSGKNNPMYGKHHTEEVKNRISEKNKGRKPTQEQIEKRLEKVKGTFAGGKNPMAKTVYQYTLDNILVNTFDCVVTASLETGFGRSTIYNSCITHKPSNGFIWSYEELNTE